MLPRYLKNTGPLTPDQQLQLRSARVCVVGCGGLGGYVIELLGRLGVGYLTAVDGDVFDATNLNRQLLCTERNLGTSKAEAAKMRMAEVNPQVHLETIPQYLHPENAAEILKNHHLVIDALDGISARLLLQTTCAQLGIPMVHGAVDGWGIQVCTVFPGEDTLSRLYPANAPYAPAEGTLSFVVSTAASMQVSEAVKVLLNQGEPLRNRILFADLLAGRMDILPL